MLSCFQLLRIQGLLERNEMRNKALGLSSSSAKSNPSPKKSVDKENQKNNSSTRITEMIKKSPRKSSSNDLALVNSNKGLTPSKARTVSSKNKDEADVGVVINITSNQNIQVKYKTKEVDKRILGKLFTG